MLNKEQRIQISKKILEIPSQNKGLEQIQQTLDIQIAQFESEDNGNKAIMDATNNKITSYHEEIKYLDGNVRVDLQESDILASAKKEFQNFFFPNDINTPLPSIPSGVWQFFNPFSGSVAIGKDYQENFGSIQSETALISNIKSLISNIQSFPAPERLSGQKCTVEDQGSCSGGTPPGATSESVCTANGGVWTPNLVGVKEPSDLVPDFNSLKTDINTLSTYIQAQKTSITSSLAIDNDSNRQSEGNTAISNIDALLLEINAWLAIQDFDTRTLPSDCSDFYNLDESDFDDAKLDSAILGNLLVAINTRESFVPTRLNQVTSYLGSVGQNLSDGSLNTSGSGFYDQRFKAINIRINLLGGSLSKKISVENGKGAQESAKKTNEGALEVYSDSIYVSKFKAPASKTGTIHVIDASGFSILDSIFVVADSQEEIEGNILNIENNTLFLDVVIPEKYTDLNFARVYKLI